MIKQYTKEGYKVLKIIRLNVNGMPDLMLLKDGKVKWVEIKKAGDTLKPLQKLRIEELREMGFEAICLHETKGIIL
jgi:hypothetical protein